LGRGSDQTIKRAGNLDIKKRSPGEQTPLFYFCPFCIFSILKVWCRFVGDSEKRFWSKNDSFFRDEIQLWEILELKIGT
jgi:hypothetical protein